MWAVVIECTDEAQAEVVASVTKHDWPGCPVSVQRLVK